MNAAPLAICDVGDFAQRNLLAVGRGEQDVADLLRRRAILRLQPDDEIERSLALHDLRRRLAADRRLDQPVDRVGAQPVPRHLAAVDGDRETRLAKLLHERHVLDARNPLDDRLDRASLLLEQRRGRCRRPSRRAMP